MPWVIPWQPPRQPPRHSMVTPRNVVATPTAPQCSLTPRLWVRVRVCVRVPWYAVEVHGRFGGMPWKMPWKVLPQVVPCLEVPCKPYGVTKDRQIPPWNPHAR